MHEQRQTDVADLFKILSHPGRIMILDVLRFGEQCVCHIEAHTGYRQAYLSQQIALLRDAGFIQDKREGVNIYYRVIRPEVYALIDVARAMVSIPLLHPSSEETQEVACSCPKCHAK